MAWGLTPSEEDYSLGQAEPLFQPGGLGYAPVSPQEQANFQSWKAQNFPEEEKPKRTEEPAPQRGTEPDVPRGTNVPQPQTSPVTVYSQGTKAGGPDPSNDPDTNSGYTATGRNLTEGMVAVDPKVYPLGSILRDEQSGRLFLAGDKHGADDPATVDVYVDPASYTKATQESGQKRQFSVVGRVNPDDMPTTPEGVKGLLDQVGQKTQGDQPATQGGQQAGVKIIDAIDPKAPYMNKPRDTAGVHRIILHGDVSDDVDQLVAYGRKVDPDRGFAPGYHFYIGRDGTIKQGAPVDRITNHTLGNNADSIGIIVAGADNGRMPTPAQEVAAKNLIAKLENDYGISPKDVVGHGELQPNRRDPLEGGHIAADVRGEPYQARLYPEPSTAKRLYPEPRRAEMPARPSAGEPQPMGPGIYNYPRADAATPEEIRMARAPSEEQLLAAPPEQRFGGETFGINPYRARMAEMALPVYGWSPSPTPVEGEGVPQRMAPPGPEPQAVTAERPFEFGIAPPQEAPPYRYGTGTLPSDYGLAPPAQAEPEPAARPVAPGTTPAATPAPKTAAQTAAEAGPAKLEPGTQNDLMDAANIFVRNGSSTGFLGTLEGISAAVANSLPDLGPITDYIRGNARHNVEEIAKMRQRIESGLPVDRDFEKSTLGGAIGMVGQMTPQVVAAVGTGGISPVLTGALSVVQSLAGLYDEERQDALAHGASEKQAHDAAVNYTMLAGSLDVASDLFIVGRLFKGAKAAKWTVGRTLTEAGKAGTFESLTEGGQQAIQNWIAKGYDPDRQVTDDVIDTIKATFLGGGFLGGAGYTAGSLLERKERVAAREELEASAETLKGVAVEPPKGELTPEEQAAFRAEEPPAAAPTAPSEAAPAAPAEAAPEEAARYSKIPPQTALPAERIYASDIVPKLIEEKKLPPDYMDYAFWERLQGEGETPEAITESFFKKNEIELARISQLTGWTPAWKIKPGETITKTASRDPNTSKLYIAPLHILAEDIAAAEGLDPMKFERGFLTSEGRFVGRQEGLAIAKKAQQKNVNVEKAQAGELFGENIRPAPEAAAPAAAKPTVSVQAFDRESGAFVETELNPSPELHNQLKREENFYATLIKCLS